MKEIFDEEQSNCYAKSRPRGKLLKTFKWIECDIEKLMLGHGVEFHTNHLPSKSRLLAFLAGYNWYHGIGDIAEFLIRAPDASFSESYLMEVRDVIEKALLSGKLQHGQVEEKLFACFNS